ncbi:PEP phosphonomutase [Streptococcus cuniculi]|uniref:PEP phosphonomutase n=1 Tax=Streptococcus cuniculi TaxID=1432788 RepID=A0A1Q8EAV7_9STRE|nr:PEP phosphonomutase [Streptococcus cuniculi]OLF48924.1 PEP phosphonomutase [Streptococcus cuniculi]
MVKRILDCTSSDFLSYDRKQLKQAIQAGEGRTICSEMVAPRPTCGGNLTNAEIARAFGADLMLLNGFDCFHPVVYGIEGESKEVISKLKELVGRPIGANLEPIDADVAMLEGRISLEEGRICSVETLQAANELGLDFICLTGNPGTGVSNKQIAHYIRVAREHFDGLIIAGKMHGAGANEPVSNLDIMKEFIDAGADVVLVPAVGTVPGFTDEELVKIVQFAHAHGALVMSAIGTSQESATERVIEDLAIRNKVAGVDIQHIGDAGYGGLANVENIFAMSVAVRGRRHTINRVATSVNR